MATRGLGQAMQMWFSGVVERVDPVKREISIRTNREVRTLRSRRLLDPAAIKEGDHVTVTFQGKSGLTVAKS